MPEREPDPIERMASAYIGRVMGNPSADVRTEVETGMLAAVKEMRTIAQGNGSESSSLVIDWIDWIISYHEQKSSKGLDVTKPKN